MTSTVFLWSFVIPWLSAFALAFIPIAAGIVSTFVIAAMRKRNLDTAWFQAISRAGGEAYGSLLASGKPITDQAALLAAAKAGAEYLQAQVLPQVTARALTPQSLAQIAGAEMKKLFAVDPTVGPGAATVTATAAPGQTASASVSPAPSSP